MDRGRYVLFPNIYCVIVGESAKIRKSVAMDIGVDLLEAALPGVHCVDGSITPEGLVKVMNRIVDVGGVKKKDSSVFIHADELATLFSYDKQRASRLTILLTQMYSSRSKYTHTIKSEAQIVLENLYPVLLAGTDPRNLKVLPEDAIGGLIGRTIFITASERRKVIAWPQRDNEAGVTLRNSLMVDLVRINALQGEINVSPAGRDLFAAWYNEFSTQSMDDPRMDAFHERCHDTALKVAILLSVSESNEMTVHIRHIAGGIQIIENQIPEYKKVALWSGTTAFQQNRAKFIDVIRRNGGQANRKKVLAQLGISLDDLIVVEEALVEEGILAIGRNGRNIVYQGLIEGSSPE
jgi:hypothetical protein